jgi:hypothetical protein
MKKIIRVVSISPLKQTEGTVDGKIVKLNRWRVSKLTKDQKHSGVPADGEYAIVTAPETQKECHVKVGNVVEAVLRVTGEDANPNLYVTRTWEDKAAQELTYAQERKDSLQDDNAFQIELMKLEMLANAKAKAARGFSMPADLTTKD